MAKERNARRSRRRRSPRPRAKAIRPAGEERYRLLFEVNPNAMFVFAEDSLRILAANDAMSRLYGWSREELLRMKATDLRPAEEVPRFMAVLQQQRGLRAAHVGQWRHWRKDGSCFEVEVSVSCLDYEGQQARLVLVHDITARRRAEQALQEERTLLRTLIDHLPDAVFVKDLQHRFITANQATARLMGARSPEELTGRTDHDLYPPDRAQQYWADEERILATGEPLVEKDEPHTDPDGNRLAMLTTKLPFRNADGRILGLVGVSRDVTERKRAEAVLRESEERFRVLFEGHGAAMLLIAADTGAIVDANPAAVAFYGYSRHELRSMRIDQINQLPAEEIVADRQKAVEGIQNRSVCPHRLANGQGRLVEMFSWPVSIQGRTMLFSIAHDITEQKRIEEALRASEERYRVVADFTYDWEFWLGPEGRYRYISPSVERVLGCPFRWICLPMKSFG